MSEQLEVTRRQALRALALPVLGTGLTAATRVANAQQPAGNGGTLVIYLSRSGNTRVIAGFLSRTRGADLFEIRTADPYPADYEEHVELARRQRDAGTRPPLADSVSDVGRFNTVFLGFPIWGGALPAPVRTFLAEHDLSGKTVLPFITHGGYGVGSAPRTLADLAAGARLIEPFVLECDQERETQDRVSAWLRDVEPGL